MRWNGWRMTTGPRFVARPPDMRSLVITLLLLSLAGTIGQCVGEQIKQQIAAQGV